MFICPIGNEYFSLFGFQRCISAADALSLFFNLLIFCIVLFLIMLLISIAIKIYAGYWQHRALNAEQTLAELARQEKAENNTI